MCLGNHRRASIPVETLQRIIILFVLIAASSCTSDYTPGTDRPLLTRWANDVSPENVLAEYPRPQMVRDDWLNLNGMWQYCITHQYDPHPGDFNDRILVPFPIQSHLSRVTQHVSPWKRLWYRRTFDIPSDWKGKNILLHFGAVDYEAEVWVNDHRLGMHRGGFDPFSFDITKALNEDGPQQITLAVWDPTDAGPQPCGKQMNEPFGIFYTAITGIWQTVWLEPVSPTHIESLRITPDIDAHMVYIATTAAAPDEFIVTIEVSSDNSAIATASGYLDQQIAVPVTNPRLWSPDSPFLYDVKVTLRDIAGNQVDAVKSYFGMRKISLGKDDNGITRLLLNNKPLFHFGTLDQGWWPDGLYTAPTDDALKYDIEITKKLGFNMARKHVKVEPDRWYYWADKLGLLVWQDMPNGARHVRMKDPDLIRYPESTTQFETELKSMIDKLHNHPCIVMWVLFNEGWGQYDTERITNWVKQYDPTRLVNNASGWADRGVGDVIDIHAYQGPAIPPLEDKRAAVLGEFGGLGLPLKGHTWTTEKNWGYRTLKTKEQLLSGYGRLLEKLQPMVAKGLAAAVYTQTTDVETEVNGLMTYDRAVIKMDAERIAELNSRIVSTLR